MNDLPRRRKVFYALSSQIAQLDNARLKSIFGQTESSGGWGQNQTIEVGKSRVFVKRLPLTDLEYDNFFSTRNVYELPLYYNYGVGSAGLGVFRELVAHVKTTNWVLEGAIESFPLMYHYRVMPFSGTRQEPNEQSRVDYINYWGGSENIGRYMSDRANARRELVLFLEYVPQVLAHWLVEHSDQTARVLEQLRSTLAFLRKNGIIHFDVHFWNILVDSKRPYLTDFGLVLDKSFSLSNEELLFFRRHVHYDYGEVLMCLSSIVRSAYEALPEDGKRRVDARYGFTEGPRSQRRIDALLANIEVVQADGLLKLDKSLSNCIIKYREVSALMDGFFASIREDQRKGTRFPRAELRRLLEETAYL